MCIRDSSKLKLKRLTADKPKYVALAAASAATSPIKHLLESLRDDPRPAVAFESPYRIRKSLERLAESLPDRSVTVTRELTKVHEEVLRGTASEILAALGDRARGEFTLVISGQDRSGGA